MTDGRRRAVVRWSEPSTLRGVVWLMGCLVSLVLLWRGEHEAGMRALATTGMVAGSIGMVTSDQGPAGRVERGDTDG